MLYLFFLFWLNSSLGFRNVADTRGCGGVFIKIAPRGLCVRVPQLRRLDILETEAIILGHPRSVEGVSDGLPSAASTETVNIPAGAPWGGLGWKYARRRRRKVW